MRIEKINENSITCTLTSFDLSVRNLKLPELFYNTEKVNKLFEEMIAKAGTEVGFNRDDMPLAIEAIPFSDGLKIIISKVSDPEELDVRFSRFTQNPNARSSGNNNWLERLTSVLLEGAESFMRGQTGDDNANAQAAMTEGATSIADGKKQSKQQTEKHNVPSVSYRAFAFGDLNMVINASHSIAGFKGESMLYKSPLDGKYVLVLKCEGTDEDDFSKACNVTAEYGRMIRTVQNTLSYYDEHYTVMISEHATQKLSAL